jgi:hypothetical protein
MRLIGLAVVLAVSLTLVPAAAEAQATGKVYRIGLLPYSTCPAPPDGTGSQALGFQSGERQGPWIGATAGATRPSARVVYSRLLGQGAAGLKERGTPNP